MTYYVVREYPSKEELEKSVRAGAKNHIWKKGEGDIREDGVYLVFGRDKAWQAKVTLRGGFIVKVEP